MRPRRPRLAPDAVQPLLALAQAQFAAGTPTLAHAEAVVTQLFRALGPELLEGLLQGAVASAPEKGGRRSVRAGSAATGTETGPAR